MLPALPRAVRSPGRRHRAPLRALLPLLALLALPACASTRSGDPSDPASERPEPEPTTLVVDNQSFLDANIYVLRGGQRVRLGLARGNGRTRLTIPANLIFGATTLQFLADPVGSSRTPVSSEIRVDAGDEVRLTIPPR
jgi:hypothetical protein